MSGKSKKGSREKDPTSRYHSGHLQSDLDEDPVGRIQRFSRRSADHERNQILRTALMRAEEQIDQADLETLPVGQVIQVFSIYSAVEHEGKIYLAVVRKTLSKIIDSALVVGDYVRFRPVTISPSDDPGENASEPEAVIEDILPRRTVLTRADSFKQIVQHPIVANAEQMLIVISIAEPSPRWGLIDRMIVAAQSGNLRPIICVNKMDLSATSYGQELITETEDMLSYYTNLLVPTLRTSTIGPIGMEDFRATLAGRVTVMAGHSGVGKSSLINTIQPKLNLRVASISGYTGKGRHTTTSARWYPLDFGADGGAVIDTPGVKVFGLWNVTPENLIDYFPDIASSAAPEWRKDSYARIAASLRGESGPNQGLARTR